MLILMLAKSENVYWGGRELIIINTHGCFSFKVGLLIVVCDMFSRSAEEHGFYSDANVCVHS